MFFNIFENGILFSTQSFVQRTANLRLIPKLHLPEPFATVSPQRIFSSSILPNVAKAKSSPPRSAALSYLILSCSRELSTGALVTLRSWAKSMVEPGTGCRPSRESARLAASPLRIGCGPE